MLCTSKIALIPPSRLTESGCTQLRRDLQNGSTKATGGGHACERWVTKLSDKSLTQSAYLPVINPVSLLFYFYQARHLLCLLWQPSSLKERETTESLCSCAVSEVEGEVKGGEMESQAGERRVPVPFISSSGMPAAWGTGRGDTIEDSSTRWTSQATLKNPTTGLCLEEGHS